MFNYIPILKKKENIKESKGYANRYKRIISDSMSPRWRKRLKNEKANLSPHSCTLSCSLKKKKMQAISGRNGKIPIRSVV